MASRSKNQSNNSGKAQLESAKFPEVLVVYVDFSCTFDIVGKLQQKLDYPATPPEQVGLNELEDIDTHLTDGDKVALAKKR